MAAKVWEANPGFERHVREGMAGFHNRPSRHVVDLGCEKDSGGRHDAKAVKGRHKPGNARQGLAEAQAARELAPVAFALSVKPKPTKKVKPLKGLSANATPAISLHSPDEANS
jgi:hypothetical protein